MFLRANKFGAVRANGFPSKLEAAVHDILLLRQKLGEIDEIKRQQTVVIQEGSRETRIAWRVDFSFLDLKTGQTNYVEAKGMPTAEYKLKLKLWRANPPADLEIWGGDYKRPKLVEKIKREG